jgi:hypothetical protein
MGFGASPKVSSMVSSVRSVAARLKRLAQGSAYTARGLAKAMPGVALTVALAGCGDTSVGSSFMNWMPGSKPAPDAAVDTKDVSKFAARPTCPNAEIRFGTESANIYAGKYGDEAALKYQINVQRVARDCDEVGPNVVARVGAAGLVVGGPKGAPGKVDVPVRIAAVNGDKVLFSTLKVVSVSVDAPDFNGSWSLVEQVNIPSDISADTIIYVGLDDKAKAAAAAAAARKQPEATETRPRPRKARAAAPAGDPNDPYPQMKPNIPQ